MRIDEGALPLTHPPNKTRHCVLLCTAKTGLELLLGRGFTLPRLPPCLGASISCGTTRAALLRRDVNLPSPPSACSQGVHFVRYNEVSKGLELLGRDFDHHDVVDAGFVISHTKVLFVSADRAGTLHQVGSYGGAWGVGMVCGGVMSACHEQGP